MNSKTWKNALKSLVDIRRDEFIQTFLMFGYNFLVIASYTMVKSIRDALFIHRVGAAKLPYVYIGIAIFAGILMQGYSRIAQKIKRSHLIMGSNLFFTLNILIFWWLFRYDWTWLSYGFYIWGDIFIAISIAQFWLTANNIFDPRQAKRLFGFILSGGTLGGITAGVASRSMVRVVGTDNLFLVVGFLLIICTVVIKQIPIRESLASAKKLASKDIGGAFTLIRKNRHLLLLAAIIFAALVVNTLIDFQFKSILQQNYKSKDALTGFFGTYYAYINILTIFFQILITGKMLKQFGVGVAIIIMPATLLLGSAITLFQPVLWAMIFVKTCEDILRLSINKWGIEILYIPIPAVVKLKAKTFIDVVVERFARGIGGIILLALTFAVSITINQMSIPIIIILAAWIYFCIRVYREYVASLETTLRKGSLNIENISVDLSDSSTLNQLLPLLQSGNERQITYALDLLQDVKSSELARHIEPLFRHDSPDVKIKVLRILYNIGDAGYIKQVETLLEDENDQVRIEAIRFVSVFSEEPTIEKLKSFLAHENPQIRLGTIACIAQYGGNEERVLLTRELIEGIVLGEGFHGHQGRLGAAIALGVMDCDSYSQGHILVLINDDNSEVAKEAMLSAGKNRCVDLVPILVEKLDHPGMRVNARQALALYGTSILAELTRAMTDEEIPLSIRRQIPKVISMIPRQESADALLKYGDYHELDIRHKILKALVELRNSQADIHFDIKTVEELLRSGIREYYYTAIILEAEDSDWPGLLRQALRERLELFQEMIFLLLGLIYHPENMYNAYRGVISSSPQIRANAIELLDNVLGRNVKRLFFPIIDDSLKNALMERASSLWNLSSMNEKEAIEALVDGQDKWLKACALHTIGLKEMLDFQKHVEGSTRDKNRLVKEAGIFALRKLGLKKETDTGAL